MLPTLCNTANEYLKCLGGLWSFSHRFWGTTEKGKKGEMLNMQTILLKKTLSADNLTVCAKVITLIKKHPVSDSRSNLVYLDLGSGFLQTVSNQMCSMTHWHLCKIMVRLKWDIEGRNSFSCWIGPAYLSKTVDSSDHGVDHQIKLKLVKVLLGNATFTWLISDQ